MGPKLTKEYFFPKTTPTQDDPPTTNIPLNKEQIELLSQDDMDLEFNKLYVKSREKLHAMLANPSEELMHNVSKYLRQNSKSLTECLNEMETYQDDIVDMVTERLTFNLHADDNDDDYNVPGTDYKYVDSFISSGSSYGNDEYYKAQEQQRKQENLN